MMEDALDTAWILKQHVAPFIKTKSDLVSLALAFPIAFECSVMHIESFWKAVINAFIDYCLNGDVESIDMLFGRNNSFSKCARCVLYADKSVYYKKLISNLLHYTLFSSIKPCTLFNIFQNIITRPGVCFNQIEFQISQLCRFAEYLRWNGDLTDVMNGGGSADKVLPVRR